MALGVIAAAIDLHIPVPDFVSVVVHVRDRSGGGWSAPGQARAPCPIVVLTPPRR
jgi:hypothetical protein